MCRGALVLSLGCGGAPSKEEAPKVETPSPPAVVAAPEPAAPEPAAPEPAAPEPAAPEPAAPEEDLLANLNAIRLAEVAHAMVLGKYLAAPAWPRAADQIDGAALPWAEQAEWKKLGWTPAGPVRGSYRVETRGGGFTVTGVIDADGDGVPATGVATHKEHAKLTSAPGVR